MAKINNKFKILGTNVVDIAKIYNHFENISTHIITIETIGKIGEYVVRVLNYDNNITDYSVFTLHRAIVINKQTLIMTLEPTIKTA